MESHPDPLAWWKNRRKMAYISLLVLLLITLGTFTLDLSDNAVKLLDTLIWLFGLIVAGYIGAATVDDIMQGRN